MSTSTTTDPSGCLITRDFPPRALAETLQDLIGCCKDAAMLVPDDLEKRFRILCARARTLVERVEDGEASAHHEDFIDLVGQLVAFAHLAWPGQSEDARACRVRLLSPYLERRP